METNSKPPLTSNELPPSYKLPMRQADAGDFLGLNPTGVKPPVLKPVGVPTTVPESDALYAVQNNLLRSLQSLDRLEQDNPDLHWAGLTHHLRQTYKTLNRWLTEHA